MDAVTNPPAIVNEPVRSYAPGTAETESLRARFTSMRNEQAELTVTIGGRQRLASGEKFDVVEPHAHAHVVGIGAHATHEDTSAAIDAALAAGAAWRELPFDERAAVFLRAADLLSSTWRDTLNAATMLGQSKTVQQAEIDAACELADFWRFNVKFAREILAEQPISGAGVWNRLDHRPLEGFVLAITPFNFTAIGGNLPTAPALMGNTVVWKPSPTQSLSAHYTMRLLEAAGLPPGVINLVTGDGIPVGETALAHRQLAGIHFTGSTPTFQHLWQSVGANIANYVSYPRLVGETGGKDYVIAHPSADPHAVATGLVRGSFEYQGQKCSASSRAYVPRSLWEGGLRDELASTADSLTYGDVADFANFGGAVIDRRSFDKLSAVLGSAQSDPAIEVLAGGTADDSEGFFIRPTVLVSSDPTHDIFRTEYFGPILGVHVYEDLDWAAELAQLESVSPYALTGAVFARDRAAIQEASSVLRFAAGNFYVNDKPTGAVVGQQPFGGARSSGTNDKAGSPLNLLRWTSPRAIKETFVSATDHRYPHMG